MEITETENDIGRKIRSGW